MADEASGSTKRLILNNDIIEIYRERKSIPWKDFMEIFYQKFQTVDQDDNGEGTVERDRSLYIKIGRVYNKSRTLRGKALNDFGQREFSKVRRRTDYLSDLLQESPRKKMLRRELGETKRENFSLKRNLLDEKERSSKLENDISVMSKEYEESLVNLSKIEEKYSEQIFELCEGSLQIEGSLNEKLSTLQIEFETASLELSRLRKTSTKNLSKKLKRRDDTIEKNKSIMENQSAKLQELDKTTELLSDTSEKLNESLSELEMKNAELLQLKIEKKHLQQNLSYYKKSKAKSGSVKAMKDVIEEEKHQMTLRNKELDVKAKELEVLEAMLSGETIQTFANGKYYDFVRQTIMELLSMNVSVNKVNDVIECVLNRFTGKSVEKLPSKGLRCQLLIEARHLADVQVGEAMLHNLDLTTVLGNTIHGDGTTKYHRHYQNFQITTSDGQSLSVGLQEIGGQDAVTLLAVWKERLKEISNAISGSETEISENVSKLISSVKNTMSDHCATNGVFNKLMQELRAEVLPQVHGQWNELSTESQERLVEMGNFFCKLHPLISFAEAANKSLQKFENALQEGKSKHAIQSSGESGTYRLVRTACGAFQKRGNQVAGMTQYFNAYLEELHLKTKLVQFEGNRFNVAFHNAGSVYYHKEHIYEFIHNKAPTTNRLLLAVAEDLQNKVFLAGIRALGLVGKLVTGPYFEVAAKAKSILELNPYLQQLQASLQVLAKDASPLFDGKEIFSEESTQEPSDVLKSLCQSGQGEEFDILTQQAAELICSAILLVLENQCEDQLPGGKYFNASKEFQEQASTVPATNVISERDFAVFDVLLKTRPAATTVALEALIMWMHNKPSKWLDSLTEEQREKHFQEARANVKSIREKLKENRNKILLDRGNKMLESERKKKETEERKAKHKMELQLRLEKAGGLWKSAQEIENNTQHLDEKGKVEILYLQLQFHHTVLNSLAPEAYYFQKSYTLKGKKTEFDSTQMIDHLMEIIRMNIENPDTNVPQGQTASTPAFVLKDVADRNDEIKKQKEQLQRVLKEARLKRKAKKSQGDLEQLLKHPEILVGKRIKHRIQENADSFPEWFDAKVTKIDKLNAKNPMQTKYELCYDADGDDFKFSFSLLSDLKKGFLILL